MFYVKYDFSSNAKVFPAGNIFLMVKILGFFITVLTCQNGLSAIYCWPSGSIKASLSLSLLRSELSLVISISFYYFLTKRSEFMWFISYDVWTTLWRLKMVQTGGFQPWNSREPIMTASRNVAHSLKRASHMHLDHNTGKKEEKFKKP